MRSDLSAEYGVPMRKGGIFEESCELCCELLTVQSIAHILYIYTVYGRCSPWKLPTALFLPPPSKGEAVSLTSEADLKLGVGSLTSIVFSKRLRKWAA